MTASGPGLSHFVVVMPVYEDREASSRLMKNLRDEYGDAVTVVAVDDGSVRDPIDAGVLDKAGIGGVVIRLRRNVGHQRAIAIGLNYVADHMPD